MAKDPAILWYFNDYLSGTELLTFEEQGAYMRLLCHQADKGHLSLDAVGRILGPHFNSLWPSLQTKFVTDEEGLYYNQRMEAEKQKRARFVAHQTENGRKGGRPRKNPEPNPAETQQKPTGFERDNPNESMRVENENINTIEPITTCNEVSSETIVVEVPIVQKESSIRKSKTVSILKEGKKSFKKLSAEEFLEEVHRYRGQYPDDLLNEFHAYWSEPDERGHMRFQLQLTWETGRRLSTWDKRNIKPIPYAAPQKSTNYGSNTGIPARQRGQYELLNSLKGDLRVGGNQNP